MADLILTLQSNADFTDHKWSKVTMYRYDRMLNKINSKSEVLMVSESVIFYTNGLLLRFLNKAYWLWLDDSVMC